MSDRIGLVIVGGIMSGVFLRSFFDSAFTFAFLTGGALLVAWYITSRTEGVNALLCAALGIISFGIGVWWFERAEAEPSLFDSVVSKEVTFDAIVVRETEKREKTVHVHVVPQGAETSEQVLLIFDLFTGPTKELAHGDHVRVTGVVEAPAAFSDERGRVFDYAGYLRARGVHYMVRDADIVFVRTGDESVVRYLLEAKSAFLSALQSSIREPEAGLGAGILLGVRQSLGEDIEQAFRETSLIHIVVLSGYNLMIVAETLMRLLAFIGRPRLQMSIGVASVLAFVVMTGYSPATVRAGIMATLVIIARGLGRPHLAIRGLCIAAVLMVFANPYILAFDPGFQLSCIATLGLILFVPRLERYLAWLPDSYGMRGILAATLAAQIAVLPLILYHTGMLSLVGVVANMLVLPLLPLAMLGTFIAGLIGLVSASVGVLAGVVAYVPLHYMIEVGRIGAALPFASLNVPAISGWFVCVLYVLLFLAYRSYTPRTPMNEADIEVATWKIEMTQKPTA
jgi:competence protein ComEC